MNTYVVISASDTSSMAKSPSSTSISMFYKQLANMVGSVGQFTRPSGIGKVIIEKSRGGRFLLNRNWDLGWTLWSILTWITLFNSLFDMKYSILTSVTKNLIHICYCIQQQMCIKFFVTDVIMSLLLIQLGFRHTKYLKMTFWIPVLWKIFM